MEQNEIDRLGAMIVAHSKPMDKPDVGALVAEVECRVFRLPCDSPARSNDELLMACRTALLALQAEVARLTADNDRLAGEVARYKESAKAWEERYFALDQLVKTRGMR